MKADAKAHVIDNYSRISFLGGERIDETNPRNL